MSTTRVIPCLLMLLSGCRSSDSGAIPSATENQSPTPTMVQHQAGLQSVPMGEPLATDDGRLFRKLTPAESGIDFVHQWDPPAKHDREIANAVAGGGVAIGDYDGDLLPDLYLTRPCGGARLYRNLGDCRFRDATRACKLEDPDTWSSGACFVDVDNDGDLDLFVCGFDCANRLFLNQGDGTFQQQAEACGLAFHGASVMMSFADYDLDGDLDAYLLTNRLSPPGRMEAKAVRRNGVWIVPDEVKQFKDVLVKPDGTPFPIDAGQYDHLYRNEGVGEDGLPRFVDISRQAGIDGNHFGLSATWWDFDADGYPDLYVSNDFYGPDHLYRNNGDGTFQDVARFALPHTPWFSMGTDAADIDNDGRLDFMASDMSGTNHFKQKVAMGEMAESAWFLTSPTPRQYMRNAVYLNSGTGRFMEIAYLAGLADTNWTWSLNFADFDNDARIDLFVSNGMTRDWFHSDLRAQARQRGEWNSGGREFWLNSPKLRERNLAFKNLGDYRFRETGRSWGLDHLGVSFGAATSDLDRDGDMDLVVNNFEEAPSLYRNQSLDGNRILLRLIGTHSNRNGIGATVRIETEDGTQVRQVSSANGFMSGGEPVIQFGLGDRAVVQELAVRWPSGHRQLFRDVQANRCYFVTETRAPLTDHAPRARGPLMFTRNKSVPLVAHRENEFDDFAVQPLLPSRLSTLGAGMAWGDVNADGIEDLFLGGAAGQAGTLLIGTDDRLETAATYFGAEWADPFQTDAASEDMGAVWIDVERDGDVDLYVASGGYEFDRASPLLRDRIYLNDGAGHLTKAPADSIPEALQSSSVATAADFDRDGDLDLFVGSRMVPQSYPHLPDSRLLRNDSRREAIRFVDVTDDVAPALRRSGLVTSALWSDVDGDGWCDLIVTHEWGPVKLFRNTSSRLVEQTEPAGLNEISGSWHGIAGRDLDNDGDIDLVVTNLGLNCKYSASHDQPMLLYYGDFDGSGQDRLVEAEYEDGVLYPVRGKSCSARAIPSLQSKFPTFESFALASLSDVYDSDRLDDAHRLAINTLEAGIFFNEGPQGLRFRPLPRLAQASPSFGVVIEDFDGDGVVDIFLNQNSFAPQPETGRMDGGVGMLLRGRLAKDDFSLEPVGPWHSGIVLAGDGTALTAADLNQDAWPDLVVGANNGPLLAFQNRGADGHNRSRAIRLHGRPGNVRAVGARITVVLDDGTQMTAECSSANGYLSQSSSHVMFGLGASREINRVVVRWPLGHTSEHDFPSDQTRLEIRDTSRAGLEADSGGIAR